MVFRHTLCGKEEESRGLIQKHSVQRDRSEKVVKLL
jgi:hypothetical protein